MNTTWFRSGAQAAIVSTIVLALFYYWFAIADRYAVFLYGHVALNIAPAQPFDEFTASRYWMAGLIAAGFVATGNVATFLSWRLVAARRGTRFEATSWWRTWRLCVPVIGIGVPAITLTVNTPTLPLPLALACAASALAGTALALAAGEWAGRWPRQMLWTLADGLGLVPALLLIRAIELPGRGLSISWGSIVIIIAIGLLAGAGWLWMLSWLRRRLKVSDPGPLPLLMAGFGWSYLVLPVAHYLLATPPSYRYITTASNFFAFEPGVQALAFAIAVGMSLMTSHLRRVVTGERSIRSFGSGIRG